MKNITLIITSKISGQITFNNKEIFQIDNNKIKFQLNFQNSFFIHFIAKDSQLYLPFLAEIIYVNEILFSKSLNLKIIKLFYNIFFISIEPTKYYLNTLPLYQEFKIKNRFIKFYNGLLEISNKGNNQKIFIDNLPINYNFEFYENVIILFSKQKYLNNLHLISLINLSHITLTCDYYNLKNNQIFCYKLLHTFLHHKEVKIFNCETLTEIDKFIGFSQKKFLTYAEPLIPYYFIQCLMVKDLKNAKQFLNDSIYNKNLTSDLILKFFGEFISYGSPQINLEKNSICLIYKCTKKNTYQCRYFNFKIENSKIVNIVEINLKMPI